VRSLSGVLLAVLCTAAVGQHRGGMIPTGRVTGGFNRVASPLIGPRVNPYLNWDLTFAQRLGAIVSGSSNGLPGFWGPLGPGPRPFRDWSGMSGFGGPGFSPTPLPGWNSAPAFGGAGFMPVPYPVFVGGSSDYYPQQPSNVTIMRPPQPVTGPPPPTIISEPVSGIHTFPASSGPVVVQETTDRELEREGQDDPLPYESTLHLHHNPVRTPFPQRAYPALISLKNGSAFTVTTYWVKGKRLHFITTQGNQIEVPFTALDRLYPREEWDQTGRPDVPPRRR
jgi:hypothetical protein